MWRGRRKRQVQGSIGIDGGQKYFRVVPEENGCNRVHKNRSTSMK